MGTWNSNSWSTKENENSLFRESVLNVLDLDVLCINETFLVKDHTIEMVNYTWFGRNRKNVHRRARRGAGGVGMLVHNRVMKCFHIEILDNTKEDILWLKFSAKHGDFVLCLCSCYLPPKDSSYKVDGDLFFNDLLHQIYSYQNEGLVCISGDVNARLGNMQDFIEEVDEVPLRDTIDSSCNDYGDIFHDHLTSCNMCVLNGRAGSKINNNFTHISAKGKSVVEYAWAPYEQLHYWSNFKVSTMSNIVDTYDLHPPTSLPDHSILSGF